MRLSTSQRTAISSDPEGITAISRW